MCCVRYGQLCSAWESEEQSRKEEERRSRNVPSFSGASPEGVCCQKLSSPAAVQCQKPSKVDIWQDGEEVDNIAHTPWLNRW